MNETYSDIPFIFFKIQGNNYDHFYFGQFTIIFLLLILKVFSNAKELFFCRTLDKIEIFKKKAELKSDIKMTSSM